jgi:hypothetical protein
VLLSQAFWPGLGECRQEPVKPLAGSVYKNADRIDRDRHLRGYFLIAPIFNAMEAKRLSLLGWKLAENFAELLGKLRLLGILQGRWRFIANLRPDGQRSGLPLPMAYA